MDWNRQKREVEERLWNLRVRDEDVLKKVEKVLENQERQRQLEQKMDMILEKLQNQGRIEQQIDEMLRRQNEMERKIEILADEINQKDAKRGNETAEIMDVVGTNLGWLEYFSEENDKFEKNMAEMKGRFQEISENQLEMKNEHLELVGKLENGVLISKIDQLMREIEEIGGKAQQISEKQEHLELVSKTKNRDLELKTDEILSQTYNIKEVIFKPTFHCSNSNCTFSGQKIELLREDGVTIECPKCKKIKIVGKLKEKHRWMFTHSCVHFQQFPIEKEPGTKEKCQICGKMTQIQDAALNCKYCKSGFHGIPREDGCFKCSNGICGNFNLVGILKQGHRWMRPEGCKHFQQFPLNIKEGDVQQCQICGKSDRVDAALNCMFCNRIFHGIPREDGCFECSSCKRINLVGKLKPDLRWMRTEGCKHYQQFPLDIKEGDVQQCQICGNSDRVELVLKCGYSKCRTVLDKNLPLREDGVSVECSKCGRYNIIGTLTQGKKWMRNNWCGHFQQVPLNKKEREKEKCPYCGKEGIIYKGNSYMSLPY